MPNASRNLPATPPVPSSPFKADIAAPTPDTTPDLVTLTGKVYRHARVGTVEPDGITYFFSGGAVKIPFLELPEPVRKQYGYNPMKAGEFAADEALKQSRLAGAIQEQAPARAQAAAEQQKNLSPAIQAAPTPKPQPSGPPVRIVGRVTQKVKDGLIVYCRHAPPPRASSLGSIGGGGGVGPGGDEGDVFGTFLLRGHPGEGKIVDDDDISVIAIEDGQRTFHGGEGADRTVRAYRFVRASPVQR